MELFEALHNLDKQAPNDLLCHELVIFLIILNFRRQILIVCQLHYYTILFKTLPQWLSRLVNKGLLVAYHIHVPYRSQDTNLI